MEKALIYASVASMIQQFNLSNIQILKQLNYEVHVACNFKDGSTISNEQILLLKQKLEEMQVAYHHIPIPRKITDITNIKRSYSISKKLFNNHKYKIIHCHSPIGGMICRLANKHSMHYSYTNMLYTAHGFHFFKGSPIKNWLLFYPVEKYFSRYTDVLITINEEDYRLAKRKMKSKNILKINGVGIPYSKILKATPCLEIKDKLKLCPMDMVILSVGELNDNKNHLTIIEALRYINNPHIKYVICGTGVLKEELEEYIVKNKMNNQVLLLGYRTDIYNLCKIADVFAFPSKREGQGLAAIEAMASGLCLITSNVHGINDYSVEGVTGKKCNPTSVREFAQAIQWAFNNREQIKTIGINNISKAEKYDIHSIDKVMKKIYQNCK